MTPSPDDRKNILTTEVKNQCSCVVMISVLVNKTEIGNPVCLLADPIRFRSFVRILVCVFVTARVVRDGGMRSCLCRAEADSTICHK